jgi:hypothetical protein
LPLNPADEEELSRTILRDQVGIDPRQLTPILELAAIGLINSAWRNTAVENWHAQGRLHDGDMLRINSHSTWRLRQLLFRWRAEMGFTPDSPANVLNGVGFDDFRWLGGRIWTWIINPSRRLANGMILRDLAGENLADLERDADQALTAFVYQAEDRDVGFAFTRAAAHGGRACRHWWGHPAWPPVVARFLTALDNPGDDHWGQDGELRNRLRPEPARVQDRDALTRTLLRRPWELDSVSAAWIVSAGIGYLRHKVG